MYMPVVEKAREGDRIVIIFNCACGFARVRSREGVYLSVYGPAHPMDGPGP